MLLLPAKYDPFNEQITDMKPVCLCAEPRRDKPGAEGAAEGVAPPPPRPGANAPAAGAHQEEREAEEGGGTVTLSSDALNH